MLIDSFIKEIQDEISVDCQLPLAIPKKSILRIMKRSFQWFHRNYEHAVEKSYHIIPKQVLETDEFKRTRSFPLPDCVIAVTNVMSASNVDLFADNPDYSVSRFIYEKSGIGMANGDAITYRVMQQFYLDFVKTITISSISWEKNFNSRSFKILGEIPRGNGLLLETLDSISDDLLCDDPLFFEYVVAQCMIALGRILTVYKMPQPGGVEPDFESIKSDGQERLQAVIEKIQNEEGVDFFMVQNSF